MARKQASPYRRVSGRNLTRHSLWQADDHLLHVRRSEFTERYERFYFRDIQAIVIQRTATSRVLAAIMLGLLALTLILALTRASRGAMVFWWILTAVLGAAALWNWRLGPTCVCYLMTAIDRYRLKALSRVAAAERVLTRLQPVIQRAQADLELLAAPEAPTADRANEPGLYLRHTHATHAGLVEPPPVVHHGAVIRHGAVIHYAAFGLMLVNGLCLAAVLAWFGLLTGVSYVVTLAVLSVTLILALIKQADTDLPARVQRCVWAQLAYVSASVVLSLNFAPMSLSPYLRPYLRGLGMLMPGRYGMSPGDSPVFVGLSIMLIAAALLIGGMGLVFLRQFRQASAPQNV
jgi:hypothetical protein